MSRRDRLRKGIARGLSGLVRRVADRIDPIETKPKQAKTKPKPPPPPEPPESLYPGSSDKPTDMLQQLSDMTIQMSEMVKRLSNDGYEKEAKDIVGGVAGADIDTDNISAVAIAAKNAADQSRKAVQLALSALKQTGNKLTEKARQLMSDAEDAAAAADQAASDVDDLASEIEEEVREMERLSDVPPEFRQALRYDWKRKPVYIPFKKPKEAFRSLDENWRKLAIGVKREDGRPMGLSQYSPFALARGSAVDRGRYVPFQALVNETSFQQWAEENGLGDGLSLEILSVMKEGGLPPSRS